MIVETYIHLVYAIVHLEAGPTCIIDFHKSSWRASPSFDGSEI